MNDQPAIRATNSSALENTPRAIRKSRALSAALTAIAASARGRCALRLTPASAHQPDSRGAPDTSVVARSFWCGWQHLSRSRAS
jgi:hypothetical protein